MQASKGTKSGNGPRKRMGRKNSETFNALLDAAELVLREHGFAFITSKRVAEAAGVKQQLVYYYFQSMDDLLLSTFKRRTERGLNNLAVDVASESPIRAIWDKISSTIDAKLAFEFVALANHHDGIRQEARHYREVARRMEAAAIARQIKEKGKDIGPLTADAAAFLMDAASLLLTREASTGVTRGHDDVRNLIEWLIENAS